MEAKDFIALGAAIVAALVGSFGVYTFWRNSQIKKAEWLEKLHSKFFESPSYKRVRKVLDYETEPDYTNLKKSVQEKSGDDDLCESFVDYLNFFEYIASLCVLKQLKLKEILMLFEYYLTLMEKHGFVRSFIRQKGFENLDKLLRAMKQCSERSKPCEKP